MTSFLAIGPARLARASRALALALTSYAAASCGSSVSSGPEPAAHTSAATLPPPPANGRWCGRPSSVPATPRAWPYGTDERCDRNETLWANVPHEDRTCAADDDCRLLTGDGGCFEEALNVTAASRSEYGSRPCGNPASGACMGLPSRAVCRDGCCVVAH